MGRQIKTQIETMLEPGLGGFVALAGRLRGAVAERVPKDRRRAFWRWVFAGPPRRRHGAGAEREAAILVKEAIAKGGAPDDSAEGSLSILVAPKEADLLTLRAVQRLQEADVIFSGSDSGDILELARRDAERIGEALTGQARVEEALSRVGEGQRVVWLTPSFANVPAALTELGGVERL